MPKKYLVGDHVTIDGHGGVIKEIRNGRYIILLSNGMCLRNVSKSDLKSKNSGINPP